MFRKLFAVLHRRVDPAPNPLRTTVSEVDDEIVELRAEPGWEHDDRIRERVDRLLDVRAVLAAHEDRDRRAGPGSELCQVLPVVVVLSTLV